jgi:hypothetical protein
MSGVARQLVTFFLLPEKKVTKENGTPHHGLRLPCATQHKGQQSGTRPSGSNSRLLKTPFMSALLGVVQRASAVIMKQLRNITFLAFCKKQILFFTNF